MGAVVLNVDLHSLDGVDSPDSQVVDVATGFVLSLILALFELVLLLLCLVAIESMSFESDELEVAKLASIAVLDAVDKKWHYLAIFQNKNCHPSYINSVHIGDS